MVIFGGWDGSNALNDVWALSLSGTPTWTQLTPAGSLPEARYDQSAIYDAASDRMVVFGGWTGSTYFNDAWALSLSGIPAWTELAAMGTPPSARYGHSAVFDGVRDRMVVFGGATGTNQSSSETWALSLSGTPAWSQLTPAGSPPTARDGQSALYDAASDRVVMFGGKSGSTYFNDSWALSLSGTMAWTQLAATGTPPSARYGHSSVYDPSRGRMVMFGGIGGSGQSNNDLWALSLVGAPTWSTLSPGGGPPSDRQGQVAIYDPISDRMIIFGGQWYPDYYDSSPARPLGDLWALSLTGTPTWTVLASTGLSPDPRCYLCAIYDPVRDRMVLFGGDDSEGYHDSLVNDVWALSLSGTPAWTQLAPAGTPPVARRGQSGIYDPVRDRMIVFGGEDDNGTILGDVWSLSFAGSPAWSELTPTGLSRGPREYLSTIYDPAQDRMVTWTVPILRASDHDRFAAVMG